MASAFALRTEIEAALADRIPSALTPAPRILRQTVPMGVGRVDEVLEGGLPVGALTEMIGAEGSGRTALAMAFVAEVTRAEKVCAWVDASNAFDPESAAASGVDLARLLWVRCGVVPRRAAKAREGGGGFSLPAKYMVPRPVKKGLHGGGFGNHPRGEAKGMGEAVSDLLRAEGTAARCAEPEPRVGMERAVSEPIPFPQCASSDGKRNMVPMAPTVPGRTWSRIEQALRVTDLLLQAGGFGAIVLELGSMAPEHVSRIPLATWFRYRAAAERTQASLLLLTQYACAKSSAGLVLRLESGGALAEGATVLAGLERRMEVSRRRFAEFAESSEKVVAMRKPPQRAGVATWQSKTTWAGRRCR